MSSTESWMEKLHIDLGFSFSEYVARNVDWPLLEKLPKGGNLNFLIDDAEFDSWVLRRIHSSQQANGNELHPISLILVAVPNAPSANEAEWAEATIVNNFYIQSCEQPSAVCA